MHALFFCDYQRDQPKFRLASWFPAQPLSNFTQNVLADVLQISRTLNRKNCQADVRRTQIFIDWPPQESAGSKDYESRNGNPRPAIQWFTVKDSKNLLGRRSFFWKGCKAGADSISPNSRQAPNELAGGNRQRRVAIAGFSNWLGPGHNFMEDHAERINVRGCRGRAVLR